MGLKRTEKEKVTIGNYDFYINKFGAFKASNLSGELVRLFTPVIASVAPTVIKMLGDNSENDSENETIFDKEIDGMAPALAGAFDKLTGNQLETIMRKLLIEEKNISYVEAGCMDPNKVQVMEWDDADELFCGELQDMYQLAIKVIQLNYKGFFTKLAAQSGLDLEKVGAAMLESLRYGTFDVSQFSELELRMYTLIKAGLASKMELEEYYDLDEALKLYALYSMDKDIEKAVAEEYKSNMGR